MDKRFRIGFTASAVSKEMNASEFASELRRAKSETASLSTSHDGRLRLARILHHGWNALVQGGGEWRPLTDDGTGDYEAIFETIDRYDSTPIPHPMVHRAFDFAEWVLKALRDMEDRG